jgi:oxygen-independent coproporphyrinogen-3 oxidase
MNRPALPADGAEADRTSPLGSPYQGYAYSYPHKSAYRPFAPKLPLADAWAGADRSGIGLYVHVPFCEMRCGFCNLFTSANPSGDLAERYLDAMGREIRAAARAIGPLRPGTLTLGGGTPTFLEARQLGRLFDLLGKHLGYDPGTIPAAAETSPKTATADRLDLLAERGVRRISIGAQSFIEAETKALGRPQRSADLTAALDRIRAQAFATLNIDLIYGAAGQTAESWLSSLRQALAWSPEELFLYPLYVRPLTGLDGRAQSWDAQRLSLYRAGRDFLLAQGYRQHSMRMFRKSATEAASGSPDGEAGPADAPLLGIGCGARSRTAELHYSTDYAVGRAAVTSIIEDYCRRGEADFGEVRYGVRLDRDARMRRRVLKGVLSAEGLHLTAFAARFGISAPAAFPELQRFADLGLLESTGDRLTPTAAGLENADAIGPLLYAPAIRSRMEAFALR